MKEEPERIDFRSALEDVAPAMYAWAASTFAQQGARQEAEDFAHEVFVRAALLFAESDVRIESFRGWMFGIARRMLLEWFRARATRRSRVRNEPLGEHDANAMKIVTSVSRRVAKDEQLGMFIDHVDRLDPEERRIVIEYLLEGRSSETLAKAMEAATAGAFRMRAMRLRERLVAEMPFVAGYFAE